MIIEVLRLMIRKTPPLVPLRKRFKEMLVQYQTFIWGRLFGVRSARNYILKARYVVTRRAKRAEPFSLWFRVPMILVLQN